MNTAKIIRHRHKIHHYINDDLKKVEEDVQFKILFSHPDEYDEFKNWVSKNGGEYKYNKDLSKQEGKFPKRIDVKFQTVAEEEICWCDVFTYYLLHVAEYQFHSVIDGPYKGEVYIK